MIVYKVQVEYLKNDPRRHGIFFGKINMACYTL